MALTPYFYNKSIRRIVVLFGTLFNEYYVTKTDNSRVKVPLAWSSKSKWYIKLKDAIETNKLESAIFPRMGFIINSIGTDYARKGSSLNSFHVLDEQDQSKLYKVNSPMPVVIDFSLYIASKTIDDGLQILEQIVPYFDPTFSVTIKELDEFDFTRDIPITLKSINFEDEYEGKFDGQEVMLWDLGFTVEANLYKNITSQGIIKKIVIDVHVDSDADAESVKDRLVQQVDPWTAVVTDEWALLESWELVNTEIEKFIVPAIDSVTLNDSTPLVSTPVIFTVVMDSLTASVDIEFNNSGTKIPMSMSIDGLTFTYTHPGVTVVTVQSFKLYVNKITTAAHTGSFQAHVA